MIKGKIVIVDDEPMTRLDIKDILEESGYKVIAEATDGFEAIDCCKQHHPDLVIMDIKMPLLDGLTATKKIIDDRLANSVILLSAFSDDAYTKRAKEYGVSGYLVKPLDAKSLIPTVEVAISNGKQMQQLSDEIARVTRKLEDRIIIERAKGVVMKQEGLSEEEAFKKIRTISMQKRSPMVDIAKLLVLNDDI